MNAEPLASKPPEDWAIELARKVYKTDLDTPDLDLMAPPFAFDADTAIHVYDALEYLHAIENQA